MRKNIQLKNQKFGKLCISTDINYIKKDAGSFS